MCKSSILTRAIDKNANQQNHKKFIQALGGLRESNCKQFRQSWSHT